MTDLGALGVWAAQTSLELDRRIGQFVQNAKDVVDLSNCDREPIHVLGTIQPIGFLIAVTTDFLVARASENTANYIGRSPAEMIGRPLADFFPTKALHDIRNRVAVLRGPDAVERLFGCDLVKDVRF